MKILIIHDRPEVGTEFAKIAQEVAGAGARVDLVQDVRAAESKLKADYYDLVAIDLTLPMKAGRQDATLENTQ